MLRRPYASCVMDAVTGWRRRILPMGRVRNTVGKSSRRMAFSVAAGCRLDPLPVAAEHALLRKGELLWKSHSGKARSNASPLHVTFEMARQIAERILLTSAIHREAVWARMRHRDRSATSWAHSRITAVESMSTLGSGPHCGAPKWAGSGSHDLTAGELENWNRSALTGGLQTMHGQKRGGAGSAWVLRGLNGCELPSKRRLSRLGLVVGQAFGGPLMCGGWSKASINLCF